MRRKNPRLIGNQTRRFSALAIVGELEVGDQRLVPRLGRQQRLGIGMARALEHVGHPAGLDDLAPLHDDHVVGDAPDDIEIVGDEQHRHADLGLQVFQELEDLRLYGDVEGGRRLVGDEQVRAIGERHRDHHPLTLAAGKLMRIGAEALRRIDEADLGQEFDDPRPGRRRAPLVQRDDLADLPLDRVQRVQGCHRLLEHDGDAGAAHLAQFAV